MPHHPAPSTAAYMASGGNKGRREALMSVIAWADVIDAPMTIDAIVRFDGGALGESKAAIARFSEGLTNHGLVERVYAGAYRLTNAGYAALGLPV